MLGMPDSLARVLGLCLILLLAACTTLRSESCSDETLPGNWKAEWAQEIWRFEADGRILCAGNCYYGAGTGKPKGWAYEPEASLWATPIDYIKLVFTERSFEGTLGSYRCLLDEDGKRLTLVPFSGEDLVFQRGGSL